MNVNQVALFFSAVSLVISLNWTASYLRVKGIEAAIHKVRGDYVLSKTWARIDNWRLDQGQTPCIWQGRERFPFFGGFTVHCLIAKETKLAFAVNRAGSSFEPLDETTDEALENFLKWAKSKKTWP